MKQSLDARDFTKAPPAVLEPEWVLTMRKRLVEFGQTGKAEWYKAKRDKAQG